MQTNYGKTESRKRRKKYRRRPVWATVLLAFISVGIIAAATVYAMTVFFKVKEIEINGLSHYTREDLMKYVDIEKGDNLFFINKFKIGEEILENLNYISDVEMHRELPETYVINVTERKPEAFVYQGGDCYVLSADRYILETTTRIACEGLIEITGVEALTPRNGEKMTFSGSGVDLVIEELLSTIQDYNMADHIVSIDAEKLYSLKLKYTDRFLVLLGNSSEIDVKLHFLGEVMSELEGYETGTIDLSDTTAARFRPGVIDAGESADTSEQTQEMPSETENEVATEHSAGN